MSETKEGHFEINMKWKNNLIIDFNVLLILILWILFLSFYSIYLPKESIFFLFQKFSNPVMDLFMQGVTFLGDGTFSIILGVIFFLFISKWKGIILLVSYILSGVTVQILKIFIFDNQHRPWSSLKDIGFQFKLPSGFIPYENNSFPSGHTTSAFVICFLLIFLYPNHLVIKYLTIFLAILVGISRMYLLQHYPMDVLAGTFLGLFFAFVGIYFYRFRMHSTFQTPIIHLKAIK